MKKIVVALTVLGLSSIVMADAYKQCATCHGANGEKVALGKSKVISTMSKADIASALKGYKDGSYGGAMKALMVNQVKNLSDADITEISQKIGK